MHVGAQPEGYMKWALISGPNFEVVKNDIGPIIVSLFGHKVAVGRGLAQK